MENREHIHRAYKTPKKWEYDELLDRYIQLRRDYGDTNDISEDVPTRRNYPNPQDLLRYISKQIKTGDQASIDISIDFIITALFFNMSGFIKQAMARSLKTATLTEKQSIDLRKGLLLIFHYSDYGQEYTAFIKLLNRIGLENEECIYMKTLSGKKDIVLKDLNLIDFN